MVARLDRATSKTKASSVGYDYLHIAVDDRSRLAYAEAHPMNARTPPAAFMGRVITWFVEHGITVERALPTTQPPTDRTRLAPCWPPTT